MALAQIEQKLREFTGHDYITLTSRGNAAISAALSLLPRDKKVLIPAEGGWLGYKSIPPKLGLATEEVHCDTAKINLADLQKKVNSGQYSAVLYENPGGYFAEQPIEEIYKICKAAGCLVILDVTAGIGTILCNGQFTDMLVGSFGEWKVVDAGVGGFISCADQDLFARLNVEEFSDEEKLALILQKLEQVPQRLAFLQQQRQNILGKIPFSVLHPRDLGMVVIVPFNNTNERTRVIEFCAQQKLEWTECPRYIRVNQPAISIEIKRLTR